MKIVNKIPLILTFLAISGCSSIKKVGVDSSSDLLYETNENVLRQSNFELVKNGYASHLLTQESFLSISPENKNLLSSLIKGHTWTGFLINETDALEEVFVDLKSVKATKEALLNYSRALELSQRYFQSYGIHFNSFFSRGISSSEIHKELETKLKREDQALETVMFSAISLAKFLKMEKDSDYESRIHVARALMNWVCQKDATLQYGLCDVFEGAISKEETKVRKKEIFEASIKKHPHNWLIRTQYITEYLIPEQDKDEIKNQMNQLSIFYDEFSKYSLYSFKDNVVTAWQREEMLRFYQSTAIKKYEILKKYEKQLP